MMARGKPPVEPYKIKVVEPIRKTTRSKRNKILHEAGLNVFNVPAEFVYIDFLTDSGTSAMSDRQWAGLMVGDESYAGAKSFYHFDASIKRIFGFRHVIPTHQGRAAERLLFETLVGKGEYVPNNIHFDTTFANVLVRGAHPVNLAVKEAYDPIIDLPFKGNMDVQKLKDFISRKSKEKIPLVMMTITNNSAAGQPVSMENIKQVSRVCRRNKIPFFFDACRFAENAYFIKKHEKGYGEKTLLQIAQEMFSYADGATMSAKKDAFVNIGGFITLNDDALTKELKNKLIISEGFPTYGGLAGRDLEAIAIGLEEVMSENYLEHRIDQVGYFGQQLHELDIPIYYPIGGHAVYILADKFLPHIPRKNFPGWALTVALYREFGIRAVEIGGIMFAKKDKRTKKMIYPQLELVRLAVPRRVYTISHLQYVIDALHTIHKRRDKIRGLKIVEQAPHLRHFTVKLKEV
jgi:tryptophanase